jgi:hypothetical protein
MDTPQRPRRAHLGFAIVMIAMGVVLLILIRRPDFDPWTAIGRYWPLILIFLGLGQILDRMLNRNREQGGGGSGSFISGSAIALLLLIGFFALVARGSHPFRISDHVSGSSGSDHTSQTVEKQGATSVYTKIDMPAGELTIDGGAAQLLDARFDYSDDMEKPEVSYDVSGTTGRLDIKQHDRSGIHIGNNHDEWNLKLGDTPMELDISMGAGEGHLNLQGMDLSFLRVEVGAGEINVNLTGERKRDLKVDIQGGVGEATIRLPKDVGVQVHANGGIGSIDTEGLHKEGGYYVNDAFGKSPTSIRMNIEGGVGSIRLLRE